MEEVDRRLFISSDDPSSASSSQGIELGTLNAHPRSPLQGERGPVGAVTVTRGLSQRRRRHLFALALGVLEAVFSVKNSISEESSKIEDGVDFVYFSSAIMELCGLAVTLGLALRSLNCSRSDDGGRGGVAKEPLEEFGAPLAILANGVLEKDLLLEKVGHFGAVCQAAAICVVALILLQKVGRTAYHVLCAGLVMLSCSSCCVTLATFCHGMDYTITPVAVLHRRRREDLGRVAGATKVLVLLPLSVDVAELVLLVLESKSWQAILLAILDVGAICVVVLPWVWQMLFESDTFCFACRRCFQGVYLSIFCSIACAVGACFRVCPNSVRAACENL